MALLVACSGHGDPGARVTVDTLESGAVHVRNSAAGIWDSSEAWRAVEELRIGSVDGADTAKLFGSIWDVTLDAFGRAYVLDRQAKEVRVFDRSGEHLRTLGHEGEGPGEFANPIALDWGPEGNLWVVDQRNARYTVFDTAGNYVGSHRRKIGGWGYPWGGGFDDSRRLYEPSYFADPVSGEDRKVYIRHAVADGVAASDTFDLPQENDVRSYRMERPDGGSTIVGIPFTPRLMWRFDRRGGLWFSLGENYRLYHRSLAGDTTRIVEREYQAVPVTSGELDDVRERYSRYGAQHMNRIISRIPEVKPAFESFVVDDQGYLWVSRTRRVDSNGSSSATLDVFDPEGRYLGAVVADIGFFPLPKIIGNRIVGVVRDSLDVSYVVVHRLEGRLAAKGSMMRRSVKRRRQ